MKGWTKERQRKNVKKDGNRRKERKKRIGDEGRGRRVLIDGKNR